MRRALTSGGKGVGMVTCGRVDELYAETSIRENRASLCCIQRGSRIGQPLRLLRNAEDIS